jgi:F-type H+-transporting ATPase subunit b
MPRPLSVALLSLPLLSSAALAAGGGGGAGMPQLDFANPLTKAQVIWGAIIFVVLYLLLSRWGLPQVASVLAEREGKIAGDLEAARAAKARADAAIAELGEATAKSRAEAMSAINAANEKAKEAAAAQAAALTAQLDTQIAQAETQIAAARTSAMSALNQAARETAENVIVRLTGAAPDAAALDRAVAQALAARAG